MRKTVGPNRWLRLRHPEGFSDDMFARFRAGARVWAAYVAAVLAEEYRPGDVQYQVFEPEISADRTVVSLPIGGTQTLGSRSDFEDVHAYLLSRFMPLEFRRDLEEGITEPDGIDRSKLTTSFSAREK
jgi:hypothetical protein